MAAQPSPVMDPQETVNRFLPALIFEGVATDGLVSVASAGTRVVLGASHGIRAVALTAHASNAGPIVFGGSGVVAAAASRAGNPLNPGESTVISIDSPAHLYLDAVTAADKASFSFYK